MTMPKLGRENAANLYQGANLLNGGKCTSDGLNMRSPILAFQISKVNGKRERKAMFERHVCYVRGSRCLRECHVIKDEELARLPIPALRHGVCPPCAASKIGKEKI